MYKSVFLVLCYQIRKDDAEQIYVRIKKVLICIKQLFYIEKLYNNKVRDLCKDQIYS